MAIGLVHRRRHCHHHPAGRRADRDEFPRAETCSRTASPSTWASRLPARTQEDQRRAISDWVSKRVERTTFGGRISQNLARADMKFRVGEYLALIFISTAFLGGLAWLAWRAEHRFPLALAPIWATSCPASMFPGSRLAASTGSMISSRTC